MDKTFASSEGRLFQPLLLFLFVLAVLFGFFYSAREFFLNRAIRVNRDATLLAEAQMDSLSGEDVAALLKAQDVSTRIEAERVHWSLLIKELKKLTPVSVLVYSYSAGEDGQIRLAGTADSPTTVGAFWKSLENSPYFDHVFVPSVSMGIDDAGRNVASFSIHLSSHEPHESNEN